jgi:hypothetical protein
LTKDIELILKDIDNEYVRENFSRILEYFKKDALRIAGFKFFEITFSEGKTDYKYPHRLGYIPKDIIVTNTSDNEAVVFKYDDFTREHFYMDVSGACTVRFFAGTYRE